MTTAPITADLTPAQREVLRHALGYGYRRIKGGRVKPGWRNHFCTGPDCDTWPAVQALVSAGLMRRSDTSETTFHVTEAGALAAGEMR